MLNWTLTVDRSAHQLLHDRFHMPRGIVERSNLGEVGGLVDWTIFGGHSSILVAFFDKTTAGSVQLTVLEELGEQRGELEVSSYQSGHSVVLQIAPAPESESSQVAAQVDFVTRDQVLW